MRDGVKGRAQIKEDKNSPQSVSCHEEVVCDFYQGCLCSMEATETRLEVMCLMLLNWPLAT